MKLTARRCAALGMPAGKSEAIFFDDDVPGFGLRVRERGSRHFVFQYKLGAKQRRMALGTATALNFGDDAKDRRNALRPREARQDPASDKADAGHARRRHSGPPPTDFLDQQRSELRRAPYPDLERHLLKHAKTLHELQLVEDHRRDIATVIASVTKNSGAVTANRVRTSLSTFFALGDRAGLADKNPVIGTPQQGAVARRAC